MDIRNARRWAPATRARWIVVIAALIAATTLRLAFHPLLGPFMPGTTFCVAAAAIEYVYGLAPAIVVMVAGLCIADVLFVPPYLQITTFTGEDLVLAIGYPLVTMLVIVLIERLRRAQYRAELIAAVASSRYDMLLRLENERQVAWRTTRQLRERLNRESGPKHDDVCRAQETS